MIVKYTCPLDGCISIYHDILFHKRYKKTGDPSLQDCAGIAGTIP